MRKLPQVEEAKALMTEAMDWSVFTWLWQKRRVREIADQANAALDRLNQEVKARWSDELKSAYDELLGDSRGPAQRRRNSASKQELRDIDPNIRLLAKRAKEADDEAHRARMEAEDTFDEAERQLNTALAREGCQKAIASWDLHEKAIRKAEAGLGSKRPAS